jgi:hypothetical protein
MMRFARSAVLGLLSWSSLSLGARAAPAAEPAIRECLDAYEAALGAKNEGKITDALARLEVCGSGSCPKDVRNECARLAGVLAAAQAVEAERHHPVASAVAAQPPVARPPAIALAPTAPNEGRSARPLYRQWWFWTAGAAVVAGGVTAVLLLSRSDSPTFSSPFDIMRADPK